MKKLPSLFTLLSLFIFLVTAKGQAVPATASPPDSSPAVADATSEPVDPAKAAEIRKLLDLTGTVKITKQVMDQMISSFRMQNNGVSSEFWNRFEKEIDLQQLVDKMVPVYAKYYTLDDLKAVNAFYETPVGQRVLATTPKVLHESMQIGQEWGREVATRLMAELKEEKEKETPAPAPATPPTTH